MPWRRRSGQVCSDCSSLTQRWISSIKCSIKWIHLFIYLCIFFLGEHAAHGKQRQVLAFAGGDVILPCNFRISDSTDFPTVEWSKEGLNPDVVFLYRDGCETYEIKNPIFDYRTSLIMKELKDGNISLRISNVKMSDAGKYKCLKLWKNAPREVTEVELVVGTSSQVHLITKARNAAQALDLV